jgi:hypothetical protein
MTRYCEECVPGHALSLDKEYATCDFCEGEAAYFTEDGSDTLGISSSFFTEGDR